MLLVYYKGINNFLFNSRITKRLLDLRIPVKRSMVSVRQFGPGWIF
jgi:hypothetical protein